MMCHDVRYGNHAAMQYVALTTIAENARQRLLKDVVHSRLPDDSMRCLRQVN